MSDTHSTTTTAIGCYCPCCKAQEASVKIFNCSVVSGSTHKDKSEAVPCIDLWCHVRMAL